MKTRILPAGLLVWALLAVLTAPALAAAPPPTSGVCGDGLVWEISTGNNTVLSIGKQGEGTGRMDDYSYVTDSEARPPWDGWRSQIQTVSVGSGVTGIGDYAFYGFSTLTAVAGFEDVAYIGSKAFSGCTALPSVTVPKSLAGTGAEPFETCHFTVATVLCPTVPAGLFQSCVLNNLILGEAVSCIEQNPKGLQDPLGGTNLAVIRVEPENKFFCSVDDVLFSKDQTRLIRYPKSKIGTSYQIPGTVTSVESRAFFGCNRLTAVTVPDSVSAIGESAFEACPKLASLSLPQALDSLGNRAFSQCTALKSIRIPDGITSIGQRLLSGCSALQEIVIPAGVTRIENEAFYHSGLRRVTIPASVAYIGLDAFTLTAVTDVYFSGSRAQWDRIEIVNNLPNYTPSFDSAVIHCEGLSVEGSRSGDRLTAAVFYPDDKAAGLLIAAVYGPDSGQLLAVRLLADPECGREYSFSGLPPAEGSRTVIYALDSQLRPLLAGRTI